VLAFLFPRPGSAEGQGGDDGRQLAAALCDGVGGRACSDALAGAQFAWRPVDGDIFSKGDWAPHRLADGRVVLFHGWIDNAPALTAALGLDSHDPAYLYGAALLHWGDQADLRIIVEYCAIVVQPADGTVRLSRSPLRAPPLLYAVSEAMIAAASVPRAIFAVGFPKQLNEQRVADSAMINFTDLEAAWFEGLARVPLGCVVELAHGQPRRLTRYYDLANVPKVRLSSTQAYIDRANALLDEAVAAVTAPFKRPGTTLSSGLDSPQVAVRVARRLPPGQSLPSFTFHPTVEWDGFDAPDTNGNEQPMVEAFAALHPAIKPHFMDNRGRGHVFRWHDLFRAMEGAPSGLCNMYLFHSLFEGAQSNKCVVLLIAEWGNYTFSDKGEWGFVEYLFTGRWRQLWLALKHKPNDHRSMLRKFIALCLVPLLPDSLWRRIMAWWHKGEQLTHDLMVPLSAKFRARSGADRRRAESGFEFSRYQLRSRAHARPLLFVNLDGDAAEVCQAFEQLYGLPCRDPMAYRPFVEFCFGLPTDLFLRDGEPRWLAKQLAAGIMPEDQRRNLRNGRWDANWLSRIRLRADDYREELDRAAEDPELAEMIDLPRLRAALDALPDATPGDAQVAMPIQFALVRGLLTARYVNHIRGRN
jgi:asparagine synthase (glutamine-hydrolysing)